MKKIIFFIIIFLSLQSSFAQTIDRSKPPKPGAAPVIKIADPVIFKLPNGLTVLVVENHKLPTVRANFRIDAGPVTEGSKAGLLSIMGGMLNEGTTSKSKAQFDEAVDILGANISLGASGGYVSSLTRYFDQAFSLMVEALRHPSFPQESFDKLISQELTGLKTIEKSASSISDRVVNALSFGPGNPSGEFETEETVKSLTLADVRNAYNKYITPARAYLTFVGDIKPDVVKALVQKYFGDWKGYPLALEKIVDAKNPVKTEINIVDVPNAVQSEINVVNLVKIPMSSPDYFPVLLTNKILGGGADARLFMNLREKRGFTYGAYSDIGTGRFQANFNASASVRNEKVDSAVLEFLNEIKRIREQKVSTKELQDAKNQYNGSFALGMENPARTADFASNILINGLPKDFYRTYLQKINAVTVDDVQRVARKYFNYTNTRIVVVGKQEQVAEGLKKLGYPVKFYDKYAKPVAETTPSSLGDIKPAQVIDKYIQAIGGREAVEKIKTVYVTGTMEVMGQSLSLTGKRMFPNKELFEITMGSNPVMRTVFNGEAGSQTQMGAKKDLSADEVKQKKMVKGLFEQLYYGDGSYQLELKGIEKVAGADAYVMKVTLPDGSSRTEHYDIQTGYQVRLTESSKQDGVDITQTTEMSDYKKVGNIMMPQKLNLTVNTPMGGQEMTMLIKSTKLNEEVGDQDFN